MCTNGQWISERFPLMETTYKTVRPSLEAAKSALVSSRTAMLEPPSHQDGSAKSNVAGSANTAQESTVCFVSSAP